MTALKVYVGKRYGWMDERILNSTHCFWKLNVVIISSHMKRTLLYFQTAVSQQRASVGRLCCIPVGFSFTFGNYLCPHYKT